MKKNNKSVSLFFANVCLLTTLALATLSCNKVNFSSDVASDPTVDPTSVTTTTAPGGTGTTTTLPGGLQTAVQCQLYLNANLQSVTITTAGPNPSVNAVCTPSAVTYAWTVSKNNVPTSVNGLQGAVSTPDFAGSGAGTYHIVLTASATGYNNYSNASAPLTVIVQNVIPPTQNVNCDPRLNGTLTSVTLTSGSGNPSVAANCQPTDSSCVWNVLLGTTPVQLPNLSGCSATPDFTGQQAGTYNIYLTASHTSYAPYNSAQPLKVIVPAATTHPVTTTHTVTVQDNQLDVLLVVDDSNSMLADNQKLAAKLQGFVNDLTTAGFDWQMCTTVTNATQLTSSDPNLYWGASHFWVGVGGATPYILKSGTPNAYQIFQNTINQIGAGWAGTDDERGIKAAYWHLWNGDVRYSDASGCYRQNAGMATLIISDEDERSVGGDITQQYYAGEYKPLETDDYPSTYTSYVKEVFGNAKRFTTNSVIVRPGDTACMATQDAQGSKSHFGTKYNELSGLTAGGVVSICDSDFSTGLKYFKNQIINSMSSLPLDCNPVGAVSVSISPAFATTTHVSNGILYFNPQVPAGRTITAQYQCPN